MDQNDKIHQIWWKTLWWLTFFIIIKLTFYSKLDQNQMNLIKNGLKLSCNPIPILALKFELLLNHCPNLMEFDIELSTIRFQIMWTTISMMWIGKKFQQTKFLYQINKNQQKLKMNTDKLLNKPMFWILKVGSQKAQCWAQYWTGMFCFIKKNIFIEVKAKQSSSIYREQF